MFSTLIPMPVDSDLNEGDVGLGDGSFPDGNGQHSHYISERERGRRPKMGVNRKNLDLSEDDLDSARFWAASRAGPSELG